MTSKTLYNIIKHWLDEPIPENNKYFDLPFNVEEFCRENDELLKQKDDKIKEFASEIVRLMAINKGIK